MDYILTQQEATKLLVDWCHPGLKMIEIVKKKKDLFYPNLPRGRKQTEGTTQVPIWATFHRTLT
jgi:hypothetical protein